LEVVAAEAHFKAELQPRPEMVGSVVVVVEPQTYQAERLDQAVVAH
jgi:hypothetical protein